MAELNVAVLIIFGFGLFGMVIEPYSPHPPVMVALGLVFFGLKILVYLGRRLINEHEKA